MPAWVRNGGAWLPIKELFVRNGGAWHPVKQAWIRNGGAWQSFFAANLILSAFPNLEDAGAGSYRAWVDSITVGAITNSIVVERSIAGGAYESFQTMNVTPGSSGNETNKVQTLQANTVDFRLTPYTGANGSGTAGPAVIVNVEWV